VTTTTATQTLDRRLGPLDAAAIIVSNVIGTGLLFAPAQVAASVPSALLFLSTWIGGGVLAFAGAMAYAELAAMRPRAGGEYVYLHEAFGPMAAFLTGWTSFVAGFAGAIATSAVVLADYLDRFIPGAGNSTPFFTVPIVPGTLELSLSPQTTTAIAAVVGMAWIHLRGVGPGRVVMDLLAILKVGAFVVFIAVGFALGMGSVDNITAPGPASATGWLLALIPVMYAYSGWNAATYVAEEVRNPGRNVPLALALGTVAVVLVHLLMNTLYVYVMPVTELAKIEGPVLNIVGDRLLGNAAGNIMGVVSIVSLLASISAMTFAGPRVYFAMARDGLFFRRAADLHPRYRTPAVAIVAQTAWTAVLILSAKADALLFYTGFAVVLFSGVGVASLFVLRRRQEKGERPFRAWGYPLAPAIFTVSAAAILLNAVVGETGRTAAGAAIILAGIPLYFFFRRGARRAG
jgi:basic amino acid/polyamine antiporter, APA family